MLIRPYKGTMPKLGARVFVAETATLIGDIEIGDDSSIWYGTVIRGDVFHVRIGARSNIQDNCTIHVTSGTWPTVIGDEVTLGHGVIAHGCTVERGALLGIGSRVLDGCVIGEESLIGAGALLTPNTIVPPRSLVLGAPAKVIRHLSDDELDKLKQFHLNYLGYKETYLAESQ